MIIAVFVEKTPLFNFTSMTRRDFEQVFRRVKVEFDSALGTASPDLYDFKLSGGKMLIYHALVSCSTSWRGSELTGLQADETITFRGTCVYYDKVAVIDPDVRDFY